jgi:chromosome segregation ATPase
MVIRTIRLMLISKEFDAARERIEAIVREGLGYVDQLSVRSNPGSAKSLSAVLRFPSDRVDAGLIELRKLGQPKEESQNSADITGQYADLVARLNNARNTEQRLVAMLRERTGKLQDVIEAEREIARVREEIERMEAEQKTLNNKVQYATVHVELTEEYRAQLEPSAPSAGTRLRNAAFEGYGFAVETVLGIILAALMYTPTLLVLAALLAPIAFVAWRLQTRLRPTR